jgi:hypothetical protein
MSLRNNNDPQSKVLMSLVSEIQTLRSQVDTLFKQNASTNKMTNDLRINFDDLQRDEKIIKDSLMRELCERDRDARTKNHALEFILDEII